MTENVINLAEHRPKPGAKEPAEIQATVTIRADGSVRVWLNQDDFTVMACASLQFLEMEKPLKVIDSGQSDDPFPPDGIDK